MEDTTEPDAFYTLRNYFYIGNYAMVQEEATKSKPADGTQKQERDFFLYRAYLAMGEIEMVLKEVQPPSKEHRPALQAVWILATYLKGGEGKSTALSTIRGYMADPDYSHNKYMQIVAAMIYSREEDYSSAMQVLHNFETMEHRAIYVHILLNIDRIDKATEVLNEMAALDDENALTQLSRGWLYLSQNQEAAATARNIFSELRESFGGSPLLSTGLVVALMKQGAFSEAENILAEDDEIPQEMPERLINLVTCGRHTAVEESTIQDYIERLKKSDPNNSYVEQRDLLESAFDRNAKLFRA